MEGVEPSWPLDRRLLGPVRIPVPPHPHEEPQARACRACGSSFTQPAADATGRDVQPRSGPRGARRAVRPWPDAAPASAVPRAVRGGDASPPPLCLEGRARRPRFRERRERSRRSAAAARCRYRTARWPLRDDPVDGAGLPGVEPGPARLELAVLPFTPQAYAERTTRVERVSPEWRPGALPSELRPPSGTPGWNRTSGLCRRRTALSPLSYGRMKEPPAGVEPAPRPYKGRVLAVDTTEARVSGDGRSRTDIFLVASEALVQLSYIPQVPERGGADGWSRTTTARGDRVTAC